jgi:antirestriction protein
MSNNQNTKEMKELVSNMKASQKAQIAQPKSDLMTKQEIVDAYGSELEGNPSVYCGTYAKYNEGSIYGAWLDISKFSDYNEFIDVCRQLHADEEDPELMFQDYDSFPSSLYCESCMGEDIFNKILEYANLDENEKEAFDDYMALGHDFDIERFREAYCGNWDSEEDFAQNIVESCYDIEKTMGSLASYFDYKAFARDLFIDDYQMGANNNVFRSL